MTTRHASTSIYFWTTRFALIVIGTLISGAHAMAIDGLTTIPSDFTARETANRLEAAVKEKGMAMFARIDHAAGATAAGLQLRPTELLIFGNAKAGTPLMQAAPTMGIDLPLKALVYEDSAGKVWLSYNEPHWLTQRHQLGNDVSRVSDAMATALKAVTMTATKKHDAPKE
jgi:uncharacterized protein (DUF302 family)